MNAINRDPRHAVFRMMKTRVAVLGDGQRAREIAHALRRAGNEVAAGRPPRILQLAASVIVCGSDDAAARLRDIDIPHGALVVFGSSHALVARAWQRRDFDVALVTLGAAGACRVAVHQDATGRALVRAITFARTVFAELSIEVSTVATELDFELAEIGERPGSVLAVLGQALPEDEA